MSYVPCFAVAAAGTRHATVLSTKVTHPELRSVTSVFCTRPLSTTNTGTVASGLYSVAPRGDLHGGDTTNHWTEGPG